MKDLVRNPIGIIALFISLIYGFANLLLGATVSSLTPDERFPLIVFIVLFPVVVLGIFYLLVSRHHGKLYAPGDYKDDRSFLRTLSPEERERKLESEAQEALPEPGPPQPTGSNGTETATSSNQRISDVRNELRLVESLVVTKLESEFGQRAERDVAVRGTGVSFDAMFRTGGRIIFLEVKTIRHLAAEPSFLDGVLYNAVVANDFLGGNFKLILVVISYVEKDDLARVESNWRRRIDKCPAAVELRIIPRIELDA